MTNENRNGAGERYAYDLLNRQTYVKTPDGKEQENLYDGEGLRAGLTENGKRCNKIVIDSRCLNKYIR